VERKIEGVGFGRESPTITHLLFADDRIVFLEASVDNLSALQSILQTYEASSGQRVNLQNSSIFFGKGCLEQLKDELKEIINIRGEALSKKYLGLPTVLERSKDGVFKYVTNRSWDKVKG
jgi:hypothetical protein